jgi:hypothetical protein
MKKDKKVFDKKNGISYPLAFRFPLSFKNRLSKIADKRGLSMGMLCRIWIIEKLSEIEEQGSKSK